MSRLALLLSLTLIALAAPLPAQPSFRLGVNLDNSGAFVNIVNHTNRWSNAAGYDSLGWPTSDCDLVLMDGRPATEWTGTIDDPEQYRVDYGGRYSCSLRGSATVRATGTAVTVENLVYDPDSNITRFDLVVGGYPNANHGLVFLNFSGTRRTPGGPANSGFTGLKVHRPGYPLATAKTFTDEYLALCRAADFACYRFYNVQNIWDGEPAYPQRTRWEFRKTTRDAAQVSQASTNGKRDGWCWEHIIELANILRKDIWINIHIACDSEYVARLAALLKQSLDSTIAIYVENSNEVWSPTQATHGPYNQAEAQARGITFDQNYARRTVELSRWFGQVFGMAEINKRVRVILGAQHAYPGRSDNHFSYIRAAFGPPKDWIYAGSTALYFGSANASSTDPETIADGMLRDIDAQITNAQVATYRRNHLDKAKAWDLPGGCTSYEGGPGIPSGGGTANLAAQILAHRTSRMRDVLKRSYLDGWRDLGGGLAMYFTLVSGYNRYGCWGITDDYTKPDRNAKMQAIREIVAVVSSVSPSHPVPRELEIESVYPQPASDRVAIGYAVPSAGVVELRIFDALGRMVRSDRQEHYVPGRHAFMEKLDGLPPGVYGYELNAGGQIARGRIIVSK